MVYTPVNDTYILSVAQDRPAPVEGRSVGEAGVKHALHRQLGMRRLLAVGVHGHRDGRPPLHACLPAATAPCRVSAVGPPLHVGPSIVARCSIEY